MRLIICNIQQNITTLMKPSNFIQPKHATPTVEIKNTYKMLVGKAKSKRSPDTQKV
jgi:hypothetical protein